MQSCPERQRQVGAHFSRVLVPLIVGILLLLAGHAEAQRISALLTTNRVYGTNRAAVMQNANATNGTVGVELHHLAGGTFFTSTTWSSNSASLATQTLFTVTVPTAAGMLLEARASMYESTGTNGAAFDESALYRNSTALTTLVGLTTNVQQRTTASFGLLWATNSITNVTISAYGTGNMSWRAALRTLQTP